MTMTLEIASYIVSGFDAVVETEHRKYSSFFANADIEIDQEIVDAVKEDFSVDISPYLGKKIVVDGYWSDAEGCDWHGFQVLTKRVVHKPEEIKIIPVHDVIVWEVE